MVFHKLTDIMFKDMVKSCKNYYKIPNVDTPNLHISDYLVTRYKITENEEPLKVFCIKFSPDGDEFYCALENGVIQLRRTCDSYLIQSFRYQKEFDIYSIKSTKKFQTHFLFAANDHGDIYVSNVLKRIHTPFALERGNEINSIDVNLDHSHLISGGKDAAVRIYDVSTTKLISKYGGYNDKCHPATLQNHTLRIYDCKFQPNNRNIFVTGGFDDVVKIWDLREPGGFVRNCRGPRIRGESIVFYKDQLLLGSCRINKGIQRWDIASGKIMEYINYSNSTTFLNGYFTHCMKLLSYTNGDHFLVVGGTGRRVVDVVCLKTHARLLKLFINVPARNFDCNNNNDHVAITAFGDQIDMAHLTSDTKPDVCLTKVCHNDMLHRGKILNNTL